MEVGKLGRFRAMEASKSPVERGWDGMGWG